MYDRIPQELKENEPFCLWRIENDKKIPYQITGQRADSSNPATFAGYDDVMACFNGSYLGIGVLTTTFTKIDIDDCVKNGTLSPLAEEVVNAVNSYTELSPSGTGIHIICYTPNIQYDKSRYYMEFHEHDPEDLFTKVAPVDYMPSAQSDRFLSFIKERFTALIAVPE